MLPFNSTPQDVNVLSNNGRTPLYQAAYNDFSDIVEYLHSLGGDVNQADSEGRTPLWKAATHNAANGVRTLYKLGTVPCKTLGRWNFKHISRILLGADPSQPDSGGTLPLHAAAYFGATEVVRILVEDAGIDVNSKDRRTGYTALHLAAQEGHKETVDLLLRLGADKAVRSKDEKTARDEARANGHFGIASSLA